MISFLYSNISVINISNFYEVVDTKEFQRY